MIGTITSQAIDTLLVHYDTLNASERMFVDAGPSEIRRALRIAQLDLARMGARLCGVDCENLTLTSDAKGTPHFGGTVPPHLSVSHSDTALAVAVSPQRIGIDIENLCEMPAKPLTRLFSAAEQNLIIDDDSFTRAWVRKEAYAKWCGTGLRDVLAEGTYDTETHVRILALNASKQADQIHYLGLAGKGCSGATITEVEI